MGLIRGLIGDHPDDLGFACESCGRRICSACRNQMTMNVGIGFEDKCSACGGAIKRR